MINVAIDLGGTRTKVGILKENELLGYSIEDSSSQDSFSVSIGNLSNQINRLLAENSVNSNEINGVGLAFPGLVDVKKNKVISTNEKLLCQLPGVSIGSKTYPVLVWFNNF